MKVQITKHLARELKKLSKKGYPVSLVSKCVDIIIENRQNQLSKIKDHALKGDWMGYREFHPGRLKNTKQNYDQWIVVYKIDKDSIVLTLVATGDHKILK